MSALGVESRSTSVAHRMQPVWHNQVKSADIPDIHLYFVYADTCRVTSVCFGASEVVKLQAEKRKTDKKILQIFIFLTRNVSNLLRFVHIKITKICGYIKVHFLWIIMTVSMAVYSIIWRSTWQSRHNFFPLY